MAQVKKQNKLSFYIQGFARGLFPVNLSKKRLMISIKPFPKNSLQQLKEE
jgi:hypothetical protein